MFKKKTDLYIYAKNELEILEEYCKGDKKTYKFVKRMNKDILKLIDKYDCGSGPVPNDILERYLNILRFKPLTPLTGKPFEWEEFNIDNSNYLFFMNKRYCPLVKKVSKETGEVTYDLLNRKDDAITADIDIKFPIYVDDIKV